MSQATKPASGLRAFLGQSFTLWAGQMGGILISVMASIFITRELGPEGRGVYTWLLTLAGVGANVALFGLDVANRRLAAGAPEHVPALVRLNMGVVGTAGVLVAVVLGFVGYNQSAAGHNVGWLVMALLTVPLNAFATAVHPVLVAQNRIYAATLLTFLPKVWLAAGFTLLIVSNAVSQGHALLVNLLAIAAGFLLSLAYMRGVLQQPAHTNPLRYLKSIWGTYAGIYVAGVSYYIMQKVDVLLIGGLMDKTSTGYYGVASNMVDLMITPVAMISILLGTRLAATRHTQVAPGLSRQVFFITMGLTVAGCGFTYVIAPWLIPFMFGAAFAPAAPILQWLCPAVVSLAVFMMMQNALTSLGRARYMAIPPVLGAVSNVGLNLVLIPGHGLVGACWASLGAYTLAAAAAAVLVRQTAPGKRG